MLWRWHVRSAMNADSPPTGSSVAAVAERQQGRIRYDQLRAVVSDTPIRRRRDDGYLHPELPRVYAVGHAGRSAQSDLAAALLYAGPGAMLSHGTAIWWLNLLKWPPERIHISTPRDVKDQGKVTVHGRRHLSRVWHSGFPTTTAAQALLDLAATGPPSHLLRLALANADYQDLLNVTALKRLTGRGIKGSTEVNDAWQIHLPQLARARSELEQRLLGLCEQHGLPLLRIYVPLEGHLVHAVWLDKRVIVELDGHQGHRTRAQLDRDHQRDPDLRAAGYIVLRYTWRQLESRQMEVAADLR